MANSTIDQAAADSSSLNMKLHRLEGLLAERKKLYTAPMPGSQHYLALSQGIQSLCRDLRGTGHGTEVDSLYNQYKI